MDVLANPEYSGSRTIRVKKAKCQIKIGKKVASRTHNGLSGNGRNETFF